MLLCMIWKQHVLSLCLGFVAFACTHESAASGSAEPQSPKAELRPEPAAESSKSVAPAACSSDADCHVVDVYCGGCQCVAQLTNMPAPTCPGQEVQCFAQPCRGQTAVCKSGACSLTGDSGEQ
jgi:hypothetical protein